MRNTPLMLAVLSIMAAASTASAAEPVTFNQDMATTPNRVIVTMPAGAQPQQSSTWQPPAAPVSARPAAYQPAPMTAQPALAGAAPPAYQPPARSSIVVPTMPKGYALAKGDVWKCELMVEEYDGNVILCGGRFQVAGQGYAYHHALYFERDGSLIGSEAPPRQRQQYAAAPPIVAQPSIDEKLRVASWNARPNTRADGGPPITTQITREPTQGGGEQLTIRQRQPGIVEQLTPIVGLGILAAVLNDGHGHRYCNYGGCDRW